MFLITNISSVYFYYYYLLKFLLKLQIVSHDVSTFANGQVLISTLFHSFVNSLITLPLHPDLCSSFVVVLDFPFLLLVNDIAGLALYIILMLGSLNFNFLRLIVSLLHTSQFSKLLVSKCARPEYVPYKLKRSNNEGLQYLIIMLSCTTFLLDTARHSSQLN